MVQEANVKRAQAEKALAESEMKVRFEHWTCPGWGPKSVVHVMSGSGYYTIKLADIMTSDDCLSE